MKVFIDLSELEAATRVGIAQKCSDPEVLSKLEEDESWAVRLAAQKNPNYIPKKS